MLHQQLPTYFTNQGCLRCRLLGSIQRQRRLRRHVLQSRTLGRWRLHLAGPWWMGGDGPKKPGKTMEKPWKNVEKNLKIWDNMGTYCKNEAPCNKKTKHHIKTKQTACLMENMRTWWINTNGFGGCINYFWTYWVIMFPLRGPKKMRC